MDLTPTPPAAWSSLLGCCRPPLGNGQRGLSADDAIEEPTEGVA